MSCNCTARARTGEWCSCSRAGRSPSGPGTIRHAPPPTAHLIRSFLLEAVAGLMPGLAALVAVAAETAAPALQQQTKTSCNKSPAATCGLGVDVCLPCTYVRERRLERMAAGARAASLYDSGHARSSSCRSGAWRAADSAWGPSATSRWLDCRRLVSPPIKRSGSKRGQVADRIQESGPMKWAREGRPPHSAVFLS